MPQQGARRETPVRKQILSICYVVEFQGQIVNTSSGGDYAFVQASTVRRMDGGSGLGFEPTGDLPLHVKKNKELGDPLPKNGWIRFFIGPYEHSRGGIEVVNARLLRPRT